MTTVNTSRSAKPDHSNDSPALSPALYGALSAATRPPPAKVMTLIDDRRNVPHPTLTTQTPILRQQSSNSSPRTPLTAPLPSPTVGSHGISQQIPVAKSPGSATALAAARSAQRPVPARSQTIAAPIIQPQSRQTKPTNPSEEQVRDVFPSPGSVTDAKSMFESLGTKKPAKNGPDPGKPLDTRTRPFRPVADSAPKSDTARPGERPRLSVEVPHVQVKPVTSALVTANDILSPKPVRHASGVATFEAVAANSGTANAAQGPRIRTGGGDFDAGPDPPKAPKPPRPVPRRAARTEIGEISPRLAAAMSTQLNERPSLPARPRSTSSYAVVQSRRPMALPNMSKRGTPTPTSPSVGDLDARRVNSLANAIVASHLASSRAPSPSKSPAPPLLPRRETDQYWYSLTQKQAKVERSTPSPKKPMLKTMRKPLSPTHKEAEPAHSGRSHFFRNPHKHHEGTRKRWRDEISLEERRRYEGVWAANRDLHLNLTLDELQSPAVVESAKNCVSGLVVRDIWSRSRLSFQDLEEIWALVDRDGRGRLGRDSFVVGTWLIDQRLKGKKLPYKVSDSVWQSARGIYGLKVPKHKH